MATSTSGPQIFDDANRLGSGSPTKPSMFRVLMSPKSHKRNQSADDAVAPRPLQRSKPSENIPFSFGEPSETPTGYRPLSEIVPNRDPNASDNGATPKIGKEGRGALHKKTKSAVSLKSLRSYMERKDGKSGEPTSEEGEELSPKKAKSSNSLSAILKRSQRGRKDGSNSKQQSRDKENRSPTDLIDNMPSPVWSQDSASVHREPTGRSRPNSTVEMRRTVADEVSLYTPKGYGPSQQRNFYDFHQPSLSKHGDAKPRPKSDILTGNRKMKDLLGLQRATSGEGESPQRPDNASRRSRAPSSPRKPSPPTMKEEPKRLSRVQAAISAFNAKERDADLHQHLNSKDLESEFEKLLVC
jgi:hypothetical protein